MRANTRFSLFAASLTAAFLAAACTAAQAPGQRRALLVGCTTYPNLPQGDWLEGPSNDVTLTREFLVDRFEFNEEDIVALVHENSADMRPTRANIERGFQRLVDGAAQGDMLFILLSGHGSQQPDDQDDDVEPDGLDEVFLPEDIHAFRVDVPVVNAITDDEVRDWIAAIRAKGASVFFVADTCHSGSMDRGPATIGGFAARRYVDPELIYGPAAGAAAGGGRRRDKAAVDEAPAAQNPLGTLVSLYAVPPEQLEKEHAMPPNDSRNDPRYGRLTYALSQVLTTANASLTYRELAHRLRWQYEQWGWAPGCYVQAGGNALSLAVLGQEELKRSDVVVSRNPGGRLVINAGSLHGVGMGAVYKVQPLGQTGDAENDGVYVSVSTLTPSEATVEPCAYGHFAAAAVEQIPLPGSCELAQAGVPDFRLTVRTVPATDNPPPPQSVAEVVAVLDSLSRADGSLLSLAAPNVLPDVFVVVEPGKAWLCRSYETSTGDREMFGPYPLGAALEGQLGPALRTIAKALNLRDLAGPEDRNGNVSIAITVEKWNPALGAYAAVAQTADGLAFGNGDKVRVAVNNAGRLPVDVTMLYIDSGFGVSSFFPTQEQTVVGAFDNRVLPGGAPAVVELLISNVKVGLEDLVVIATQADPAMRQHFAFLEQEGLAAGARRGLGASPLANLLEAAAFGGGMRAAMPAAELSSYSIRRVSWTVK
jgi:hypothetical protein